MDKDIVIASVTALVDAINKAIMFKKLKEKKSRQSEG